MRPALLRFITVLTLSLAVLACSPESRYETLSFFFDGVPLPGENPDYLWRSHRNRQEGQTSYKSHGPFAAKMCDACHMGGGGQIKMPVEQLCLNCHDLNIQKKHVHGPVASGGCRVCHNPHGSGKAFLLVDDPRTFCFYCHDKEEVESHEVHRESGMECTECHNPHASDNDFLLN